ncbi:RNA-directed DNA polymerase, eukaryota, nucleotide-binding alpha-beta plait domain protein [Tanacetum coccineum]
MAIGTGHRSNNYSESKRNDHLDNNRRQEKRNKGIPNKSHPNFREEHKSFTSIFVSNIPWNASVQDLWDICNKWGVVIDVYIAAKRSKSGHRFGFMMRSMIRTYHRPETFWDDKPSRPGTQSKWTYAANTVHSKAGAESGGSFFVKSEEQGLYNDGCIKDCMEKNSEDDAVKFLGSSCLRGVW